MDSSLAKVLDCSVHPAGIKERAMSRTMLRLSLTTMTFFSLERLLSPAACVVVNLVSPFSEGVWKAGFVLALGYHNRIR